MTTEQPLKYRGLIYAKKNRIKAVYTTMVLSFLPHSLITDCTVSTEAIAIASTTQKGANKGNQCSCGAN
jgi:hypothetical protein